MTPQERCKELCRNHVLLNSNLDIFTKLIQSAAMSSTAKAKLFVFCLNNFILMANDDADVVKHFNRPALIFDLMDFIRTIDNGLHGMTAAQYNMELLLLQNDMFIIEVIALYNSLLREQGLLNKETLISSNTDDSWWTNSESAT